LKGDYQELTERFGANLKKIRDEKGLSLRALASKCDLDDSQISKIENAKWDVQLSTVFELAKGLEVDPKALLDFKF
jgi:transcriptional regulator with XRE-family HTH domain